MTETTPQVSDPTSPWQSRVDALAVAMELLGAEIVDHAGTPDVQGSHDVAHEHQLLRETIALAPMPERDSIVIGGPDRLRFLQGLLTQDVSSLTPGHGCYAGLLTPKGKLQTDMRIAARSDDLLVDLPWRRGPFTVELLDRYLFRDKVTLTETSATRVAFLLAGPRLEATLHTLGLSMPSQPLGWKGARLGGRDIDVVAADWLGDEIPAVTIWAELDHLATVLAVLVEAARGHGGDLVGTTAVQLMRLRAGVPTFGIDLDEDTIPLESASASRMLSFDKGCYVGQEIIARVDARGAVNRHLVGLEIVGADDEPLPPPGTELLGDQDDGAPGRVLGALTSVGTEPDTGQRLALGWVKRGYQEPGTVVRLAGHSTLQARVR